MASIVLKRMAFAFPVFRMERLDDPPDYNLMIQNMGLTEDHAKG
jgi:hypothetical protein